MDISLRHFMVQLEVNALRLLLSDVPAGGEILDGGFI